jgi:hypothetical protein
MLAAPLKFRSNTAPLVGGLVILALAAIAIALPPSPIETEAGTSGIGTLESPGLFSSGMAEQNAVAGYGYLTLDLSSVALDKNSLWRDEMKVVAKRRFPVWGWIDTTRAIEAPAALVSSLNLSGVYVYGPDAVAVAAECRGVASGRPVIPVVASNAARPSGERYGVLVDLDTWLDSEGEFTDPILMADQLNAAKIVLAIEHARKLADDGADARLLVSRVAVK